MWQALVSLAECSSARSFLMAAKRLQLSTAMETILPRRARVAESHCPRLTSLVRALDRVRDGSFTVTTLFLDKRTNAWLKLKKDYVTGLGDSLDLIPIGAWHGIGRKVRV
jgi:hypothetical protein